ncbi:MAG: 2,4-dienoyl-CoA reductase [NADPH] [Candidatus Jettenia ecosi]|uniref:2,4-dienoyl-CoA reductase [NADPH] n=1 Tax=Candidatus Jettenia ecosi TaxID=2494326 RepID=A0A533QFT1_9BACT|nr:MAG: 2,4-dienoyl-CoA reductase [NADPH] [Candidatus Jettenia ecosi]
MSKLFEEIPVGQMTVKNRIIMSAMDLGFTSDGTVNDRIIRFYEDRAKGGVGLIVVGGCYPEINGKVWKSIIGLDKDELIPGLRRLTDTVHAYYQVRIAAQLLHGGRSASSFFTKMQPVSPSPLVHRSIKQEPHALTVSEIKTVIGNYVSATVRAKKAGFDAVELHGGMGYLINQFLSKATNKRDDEYGGSLENRVRFAREIIIAIKEAVGKDYPIIFRMSGDDLVAEGLKIDESLEIARMLEQSGADAFNVSPGWHESRTPILSMIIPRMAYTFLSQRIKSCVKVPVIASVRINDLTLAGEILDNEQADMVSLGRPLIVDPDLPNKYKNGQFDDIRTCIACNQGCFDSLLNFKSVSCTYNAMAGHEGEYKIIPSGKPKKVVVVGGGPAGMEAARVLALRGHRVTLYERKKHLGGQLRYAFIPPGREEIQNIITYLEKQIFRLKVHIKIGKEADLQTLQEEHPDAIVVATGGNPVMPDLPGIKGKQVYTASTILEGKVLSGKDVVILGGGTVGCEVALHIAKQGTMRPDVACFLLKHKVLSDRDVIEYTTRGNKSVTILEMKKKIGGGFGISTRWVILNELKDAGVKEITEVRVKEIINTNENGRKTEGVVYEKGGKDYFIKADTVIIAVGYSPYNDIQKQIEGKFPEMYCIGDCVKVRTVLEAIHEGFEVALKI